MMTFREILDGLLEKAPPADEYKYPDMPIQNPDDFSEYAPAPGDEEKTETDPIRVVSNALDFLQEVVEEVTEWIERETGAGHRPQDAPSKPLILRVNDLAASDFAVRRYGVGNPGSTPLAFKKNDRKSLRVVNWGPDIVYIAHESIGAIVGAVAPINALTLLPSDPATVGEYYPLVLQTQDEVWAIASGANVCTVEVADFFGVDNA